MGLQTANVAVTYLNDLDEDPAPDLLVEIDATSSSQNHLQVYTNLGVAEVWIYNGESLIIHQLQSGAYITSQTSHFSNIPIPEIAVFYNK